MVFEALSAQGGRGPDNAVDLRRALTALLRRRVLWLRQSVDPRSFRAVRLLSIMLHASFDRPNLREDAPGVAGLRYRPSWPLLARTFDLPPPFRSQKASPLVEAVLASPVGNLIEVVVLVAPGQKSGDLHAVAERANAALSALRLPPARIELRVSDAAKIASDREVFHRSALCGALVAGQLSIATWNAFEQASREEVNPAVLASLASSVPSPLAALALTLISEEPTTGPLAAATRLLRKNGQARRLADPAVLSGLWAAEVVPRHRAALERAVDFVRPDLSTKGARPLSTGVADVLALCRELSLAAAFAIRRSSTSGLGPHARDAWREAVGTEIPQALIPALGKSIREEDQIGIHLEKEGNRYLVRLPSGAVLGSGATPVQARVRALSLFSLASPGSLEGLLEAPWKGLLPRLSQPRERATLVLVVEPATPSGPPFDPVNRGPTRALGFPGALAVTLAPGRRPSARVLTAEQTIDKLLRVAAAGHSVEVVPARSEAHPVAARLGQLAALAKEGAGRMDLPVALETGGRVVVPREKQLLRYSLDRFTVRPRVFVPDPDAPDLALSPGERRPVALGSAAVVECRAQLIDERRASVLYADGYRGGLREIVFVEELEEHLRESRAILQQADPSSVLAVRLSEDVEPAVRRLGRAAAPLTVAVRGRLPHDLQVDVGGERYGGYSGNSWRHAALSLVSTWPRGGDARLSVNSVAVAAGGKRVVGLMALYARSVALRRLRIHLSRALRSYRSEGSSRRGF